MTKQKMAKKALLLSCVMLAVRSASAADGDLCGSTGFAAISAYTGSSKYCVCPVGVGKLNAVTTATAVTGATGTLPYTASGYFVGAQTVITFTVTTGAATIAQTAALCSDILPGYA